MAIIFDEFEKPFLNSVNAIVLSEIMNNRIPKKDDMDGSKPISECNTKFKITTKSELIIPAYTKDAIFKGFLRSGEYTTK